MRNFNSDYLVGRASEEKYLPSLQKALNDNSLTHTKYKSDIFDYKGENKYAELKTRTFEKNKYPDTMVGLNKIEYAKQNPDTEFYFVFAFTDGLYYWKYNEEDQLNYRKGGRTDRGYNEIKPYVYIPISLLKNISVDNNVEHQEILL
jgi:hypothetical protein